MIKKILSFHFYEIPVIATLVGGFISMATMFLWYGAFFVERYQPLMGIVEEQVTAVELGKWYPIGIFLAMLQGVGIAIILKWRTWPNVWKALETGIVIGVFFGALVFSFDMIILPDHNVELFWINASGIITAWTLAAITITLLRPQFYLAKK